MKRSVFKYLSFSVLAMFIGLTAMAQETYVINEKNSNLKVTGTSSVHDWEMKAVEFKGNTSVQVEDNKIVLNQVDFAVPVEKLTSDNKIMDNKASDALNQKRHPLIKFVADKNQTVKTESGTSSLTGNLTIAGETRKVTVPVKFGINGQDQLQVEGKLPLKMSQFKIDPPTAMLGTLKTGDEVVIVFNFQLEKGSTAMSEE